MLADQGSLTGLSVQLLQKTPEPAVAQPQLFHVRLEASQRQSWHSAWHTQIAYLDAEQRNQGNSPN
jgi:hypothetical protein